MFGLENLIMQAATTLPAVPAGADPNISVVYLIIGSASGGIGALISYLKSKEGSELAKSFAMIGLRKSTEAKAAVVNTLDPEVKEEIKLEVLKKLKEEVKVGNDQEETILLKNPQIDPVKKLPDLPREPFNTKPKVIVDEDEDE